MDAAVIGNLLGRLVASALIVYVVIFCINRFHYKPALQKMRSVWAIAATLLLFMLGLASHVSAQETEQERAMHPFAVTKVPEAGLQIYVPDHPPWHWETAARPNTHAIVLTTPARYYPSASIEIARIPNHVISPQELPEVMLGTLTTIRQGLGISAPTTKADTRQATYGGIKGYEEIISIEMDGEEYDGKSFMGIFPTGHPITFFLVTPKGQLEHIAPIIDKILSNTTELPAH